MDMRSVRAAMLTAAVLLPLGGLSAAVEAETSLANLQGPGRQGPAGGVASPGTVAAPTVRGGESAAGLARRLDLTYEDGGTYVLLSDSAVRVRVYPNTHMISLDGQDQTLRGYMQRGPAGVLVPGPAVQLIEAHVGAARARRQALLAPPAPPPVLAPLARLPAPKPAALPSPARPTAAPGAPSVTPDPGWAVAPTGRAWRWIVLHHSDDTSGCLSKYHQVHLDKGWEHGCGYHFVIGNGTQSGDGAVEVSNRWRQQLQGAHAKTDDNLFNEHGVGICLVGNFEEGTARPTAAQMRSLVRLVQFLIDRYDIRPSNVIGHSQCKPTACPGKNFPWAELRAQLRPARKAAPLGAPAAEGGARPLRPLAPVALAPVPSGAAPASTAPARGPLAAPTGLPSSALPAAATPPARAPAMPLGPPPADAVPAR